MAISRAQFENIPIHLVTSVPSIETFKNIQTKKYRHIKILKRYENYPLPKAQIINLNIKNIGINNRNLISLETNVLHCLDVYEKNKSILKDYNIIAESGFSSNNDINKYLDYGIERFLIGEHLLKESF